MYACSASRSWLVATSRSAPLGRRERISVVRARFRSATQDAPTPRVAGGADGTPGYPRPMSPAEPASLAGSDFLRACRRQPVERVPVWFMRQAGRSLPEYRSVRGDGPILETVAKPEVAA